MLPFCIRLMRTAIRILAIRSLSRAYHFIYNLVWRIVFTRQIVAYISHLCQPDKHLPLTQTVMLLRRVAPQVAHFPRRSDPYQSSFCLLPPCFFSRVERNAPRRVRPLGLRLPSKRTSPFFGGYPSSNRTCSFPAYGFPCGTGFIGFAPLRLSAPFHIDSNGCSSIWTSGFRRAATIQLSFPIHLSTRSTRLNICHFLFRVFSVLRC